MTQTPNIPPQRPQPQMIRRGVAGYNMDDADYIANASIHRLWEIRQQEIKQYLSSLQPPSV